MNLSLNFHDRNISRRINISGSKSESNRLLILQKFYPQLILKNISDSDDTQHLQEALASEDSTIDIGHAGTAMRFLTAYFAVKQGCDIVLTGSERMQNRPIKILVEALKSLGANIEYVDKIGYPPLRIKGSLLDKSKVKIQGNVSSQYISALMLIAPQLKNGLEIELLGKITSVPYLEMTLSLLRKIGVTAKRQDNIILIKPCSHLKNQSITIESDWSSASYFYSMLALSKGGSLQLSAFAQNSLQGDISLIEIYKQLGIKTTFSQDTVLLEKFEKELTTLDLDLSDSPDLAQTVVVTCFGLGIGCELTGLHTLKIKETDRLVALRNELKKLGAEISITDNSLKLEPSNHINENISIDTYQDHRMAMAFAPLSLKVSITINDAEVVSKSYKDFWHDFKKVLGTSVFN